MKNYYKYFDLLPPGYRERAKLRFTERQMIKKQQGNFSLAPVLCLRDALHSGILWEDTKEGHNFWRDLSNFKNPPLPPP